MRPRVLYVTHRVPYPPDRGDRIRTWNVLKFLASRADVDLACLADEPVSQQQLSELHRVANRLAVVPHAGKARYVRGLLSMLTGGSITAGLFHNAELEQIVKKWRYEQTWDAVIASSSGVAGYLEEPCVNPGARRWVDLIDVDSQKWRDYSAAARFPMNLVYRTEAWQLRSLEKRLARSCERLLVVSDAEKDLFRSFCPTDRIQAIGNGVDAVHFAGCAQTPVTPKSCTFVGVMNYKPNADAVLWFADHVWPLILQKYPDARFRIVGKSPTEEVIALGKRPGIQVTGLVPDVRSWLHSSSCVVVPLQIARGVQNKVLEAMAAGRPVVCSPAPLKGLHAEPGLHLLKADGVEEWVRQISRLFEDSSLQQEIGMAAAAFVQLHHSWDQCLMPLEEFLAADQTAKEPERQVAT